MRSSRIRELLASICGIASIPFLVKSMSFWTLQPVDGWLAYAIGGAGLLLIAVGLMIFKDN